MRLRAYQDGKGVWTIGVGHTGLDVHPGLEWTSAQSDRQLDLDIRDARAKLYSRAGDAALQVLTDHQYAALLSFVFNLGVGGDKPEWKIWSVLRAGKLDAVPTEMGRFVNMTVAGRREKVKGLVNRRAAEVHLWEEADEKIASKIAGVQRVEVASGTLRDAATPPNDPAVKPLRQSTSFIAACGAAVTSACAGAVSAIFPDPDAAAAHIAIAANSASAIADKLAPAAEVSHTIAHARTFLIVGASLMAAAAVGLLALRHNQAKAQ